MFFGFMVASICGFVALWFMAVWFFVFKMTYVPNFEIYKKEYFPKNDLGLRMSTLRMSKLQDPQHLDAVLQDHKWKGWNLLDP